MASFQGSTPPASTIYKSIHTFLSPHFMLPTQIQQHNVSFMYNPEGKHWGHLLKCYSFFYFFYFLNYGKI